MRFYKGGGKKIASMKNVFKIFSLNPFVVWLVSGREKEAIRLPEIIFFSTLQR